MKQPLSQKVLLSASASTVSLTSRFFVQILLARLLGPQGMGQVAYITWLAEITSVLFSFSLPSTLTKFLAELRGAGSEKHVPVIARWIYVRYVVLLLFGATALSFYLIWVYDPVCDLFLVLIAGMLLMAKGLESLNSSYLSGRERFDTLARINLTGSIVLLVAVAFFGYLLKVKGAVLGYLAGAMVPAACSLLFFRQKSVHEIDSSLVERIYKFAIYSWLSLLISTLIWSRTEIFFIDRYWGSAAVGIFTVGLTFSSIVQQASGLLSGAFMAHFSNLVGAGDKDTINRHYRIATTFVAMFSVPMAFMGAAVMPQLLPIFFGRAFEGAVESAMVLILPSALSFSFIGSSLVYANERADFIFLGGLAGALMSVSAGFLIIPKYGVLGAAWSRLIIHTAMIFLGTWFIWRVLGFSFPFRSLFIISLASVISATCAFGVSLSHVREVLKLAFSLAIGLGVYLLAIKTLRLLGQEEKEAFKLILAKLPSPLGKNFERCLEWLAR
ncbi:MAG: oligosaccharide flippase family protein [Deltaproteobacteria bacterium]|nr:oligosaccharide flippase family protein [Deltaproteobacteria bacterium]MDW8034484.1 oligosaccharide flippase family protein [Nitrososphaerota archaeon]